MFIFCGTEMQFVTYLCLIRDRLEILNALLMHLSEQKCSMSSVSNSMQLTKVSNTASKAVTNKNREYSIQSTLNRQNTVILSMIPGGPNQMERYIDDVNQLQLIFNYLEKASMNIASSFSLQIVVILIIKFTAFTSLLYFNTVILIRLVWLFAFSDFNLFLSRQKF